jgi:glycosyltransferase involved in cell wall biosynthesis
MRVAYVLPEPTPYRTPLLDQLADRPDVELFVIYSAATVQGRLSRVDAAHPHLVLRGRRLPGARRLLRHDYPIDVAVWRVLGEQRPDCVVAAGWSTFASQVAVLWARLHRVPYLVTCESHEREPRAGWKRALKRIVLPRLLGNAAGVLVTGSLARRHAELYGAEPGRIRVFANTVDVDAVAARIDALRAGRRELRRGLGIADDEVAVLTVARLVPEKGLDTLAAAAEPVPAVRVLVAGDGPERRALEARGGVTLLGDLDRDRLLEAYAAADIFALLSRREPWGVVVNEAAAAGLPLLLSDQVGAGADLLREGENGELVPADDVGAARRALERLARDPSLRERYAVRSRELIADWGYGPNVDRFVAAVRAAT